MKRLHDWLEDHPFLNGFFIALPVAVMFIFIRYLITGQ